MVVAVRDISKSFGDVAALCGVGFEVSQGEVFGVLGPNGAGKTTLMEILYGLQRPDVGVATVFDFDTSRAAKNLRGLVGVMSQDHWLPPLSKLAEIARVYAILYPDGWSVDDLFEAVDLRHKRLSRISRLSAGQRQRFAFGLAVMGRPKLLFLDEPTTALDPQARRFVWNFVERARREWGCTIVLTTHSMDEAQALCDRVIILDKGRVVALGAPNDLIAHHCPGYVVHLAVDQTVLAPTALKHDWKIAWDGKGHATVETSDLQKFTEILDELGLSSGILRAERHSLEDVFLTLTGRELRD
jgi:ABC-2 type transport system ATP-binding protein